jgi:hypothetical protein
VLFLLRLTDLDGGRGLGHGFNRRKMEDQRRTAAEKEAATTAHPANSCAGAIRSNLLVGIAVSFGPAALSSRAAIQKATIANAINSDQSRTSFSTLPSSWDESTNSAAPYRSGRSTHWVKSAGSVASGGLRRFPPPWSVEELDSCFVVKDRGGQKLAFVYFEDEAGKRVSAPAYRFAAPRHN